jgi:ferredoxin
LVHIAGAIVRSVRIVIRADRCEGHGRCYDISPELFQPDVEGHVELVVRDEHVPSGHIESAAAAVRNCPERALSLEP